MIDTSLVEERFLLLSSLSEADETVEALCQSGVSKVEHMLKSDADLTDVRVIDAAAGDAFYQWILIKKSADTDSFRSFRAGDITVQNDVSVSLEAAGKIRDEAFKAISDLLIDRDFYFGEVLINDVGPTL
ncbi:MAG: hypothetical protein J5877_06715 [Clostridia bacterium]|nr:hypothetical protein [Clostridia bacterium]